MISFHCVSLNNAALVVIVVVEFETVRSGDEVHRRQDSERMRPSTFEPWLLEGKSTRGLRCREISGQGTQAKFCIQRPIVLCQLSVLVLRFLFACSSLSFFSPSLCHSSFFLSSCMRVFLYASTFPSSRTSSIFRMMNADRRAVVHTRCNSLVPPLCFTTMLQADSFRLVSFRFVSFRLVSFRFVSSRLVVLARTLVFS